MKLLAPMQNEQARPLRRSRNGRVMSAAARWGIESEAEQSKISSAPTTAGDVSPELSYLRRGLWYVDNHRVMQHHHGHGAGACRWEIRIDGQSCPSGKILGDSIAK